MRGAAFVGAMGTEVLRGGGGGKRRTRRVETRRALCCHAHEKREEALPSSERVRLVASNKVVAQASTRGIVVAAGRKKQASETADVRLDWNPGEVILINPEGSASARDASVLRSAVDAPTFVKVGFGFVLAIAATRLWSMLKPRSGAGRTAPQTTVSASSQVVEREAEKKLVATPKRHRTSESANDLLADHRKKFILVGGKGGVGKTSMSAAIATKFADSGAKTLIVSTDPAHSLSDSFDQQMRSGSPTQVNGIENLYVQEIDPERVKQNFKLFGGAGANMGGLLGAGDDMGLGDLDNLFETLPPGFDEAVALVEIVKYIVGDAEYAGFERIVFDTAPTGHTLRLLSLPEFMDSFLGKIGTFQRKMGGVMKQMQGMFGLDDTDDLDTRELDALKQDMRLVRDLFRDEERTEFIVATIPNMMSISESSRLVDELRINGVPVQHVFVNQVQPENADCQFCSTRHKEQQANMRFIEQSFKGLAVTPVQFFDREIRGAYALRAMADQIFPPKQNATASEAVAETAAEPLAVSEPSSVSS